MDQGAQRYLSERLSIARDRPDQIEVVEWRKQMLAGFGGALEALRAAGVIAPEEVSDWNNRMFVALGLAPIEPLPPGFRGGRSVYIGEGDRPPPPKAPPPSRFLELLPVIGADRPVPHGGGVQILGIERYDNKIAVTWRLAPLPDPEMQFAQQLLEHERDTEGLPDAERQMMRRRLIHQLNRAGRDLGFSDDVNTE